MSGIAKTTSDLILGVIRKESWILDHFEIFVNIALYDWRRSALSECFSSHNNVSCGLLITKKYPFVTNYCILRLCLLRFRRFPPIYFVRHENGGSRRNHEFTTSVHELTACLGVDRIDLVITVNTSSRSQWNAALNHLLR